MSFVARAKATWEIGKGNKASERKDRKSAAEHYRRAKGIAAEGGCLDELLTARIGLSEQLFETDQVDECRHELQALIEDSRAVRQVSVFNHPTLTWEIRVEAIKILLEIEKTQENNAEVDRLVDLLITESPGPRARGTAFEIAAAHLASTKKWSEAARRFSDAETEFAKAGAIEDRARMAWSEAVVRSRAASFEEAIAAAEQSEKLFDTCGSPDLVGDCVLFQADLAVQIGDADLAFQLYDRAAQIFTSTRNTVQHDNVAMAVWRLQASGC